MAFHVETAIGAIAHADLPPGQLIRIAIILHHSDG